MNNEENKKVKGVADIIFLVDATGSMQPGIDNLKNNIEHFFDLLENPSGPNGQLPVKDWRAAVYAYRDYAEDGPKWFEPRPFVRGAAAVKAQLAEIKADGGGDEPEDLVDALLKIADMDQTPKHAQMEDPEKWRYRSEAARVVVVMTDASFHMPPPTQPAATIADLDNKVCEAGLRLSLFVPSGPDFSCYNELSAIDKCEVLPYPVAAHETPSKALASFTGDEKNFTKTLEILAKSVSTSSGEIAQLP